MSFVEGFRAGSDVVGEIQNAIVAKKMRELENQRYADETAYKRGRDKVADERYAAELTDRARRQDWAESVTEYEKQHQLEREKVADARDNRDYSTGRGDKMLDQVRQALDTASERRRRSAEIERILAQAKYYNAGGAPGRAAMGYDEYDENGQLVKRRVPVGVGSGAPDAQPANKDPEAMVLANEILKLQSEVGEQKKAMAEGDNRTGFLNFRSRQGVIDDAQRKIANLQRMQGGQPQPAQPVVPQAPQQQGGMVPMVSPSGQRGMVPIDQVQAAEAKGFRRG
ncbi:MAG TPA: hypothetical protein VK178_07285 [Opitutaceae bacterium]|nr:hypothetical protein [Opitutaceae bacterium]